MSTEPARSIDSNDFAALEQRARRRLVAEKGFYVHLVTYVMHQRLFHQRAHGPVRWGLWCLQSVGIVHVHGLPTSSDWLCRRDWEDRGRRD